MPGLWESLRSLGQTFPELSKSLKPAQVTISCISPYVPLISRELEQQAMSILSSLVEKDYKVEFITSKLLSVDRNYEEMEDDWISFLDFFPEINVQLINNEWTSFEALLRGWNQEFATSSISTLTFPSSLFYSGYNEAERHVHVKLENNLLTSSVFFGEEFNSTTVDVSQLQAIPPRMETLQCVLSHEIDASLLWGAPCQASRCR